MKTGLTKCQKNLCIARLSAALRGAHSAGAALMALRGAHTEGQETLEGQLKTAVDQAAEGWVLNYLRALFPKDCFLCEEQFEQTGSKWHAPANYWTIDALDGTRSFVEGYAGFCVQVAFIHDGQVQIAVVHEPVKRLTYWALVKQGAFVEKIGGNPCRLTLEPVNTWPKRPIFIDSTRPSGVVGDLLRRVSGEFRECGSIGIKICRVADGSADVFVKELNFKLWDVAPGDLILREAGGRLGLWTGEPIPYHNGQVYFDNLLAAPSGLFDVVACELTCQRALQKSAPR